MTRRRLNRIRLDKIAAVDQPCQEHATVAIIKRAPPKDGPPAMAKKTFQQALNAQLISERISDTFWRAFEKQWAVREAFRTALTDEISEGGDGETAITDFTAAMNQIATLAAEAAREAAEQDDTNLETAVEQAITKWLVSKEKDTMTISTKAALKAAIAKFVPTTSTVADLLEIQKAAVDLGAEDELPVEGPLAKAKAPDVEDKKKVKALEKQVAVLGMAPAIRKHYDGLAADAQDGFIAKSEAERQAEVDAIEKGDPVVYTTKGGVPIRKSDGATVLALAKQNDEQAATIATLSASTAGSAMAKRAATEFPNVGESVAVEMLKSAATVGEDTDAGKAVLKTLKTMNRGASSLFKSIGTTDGGEGDENVATAREEFNAAVDKMRADLKLGHGDAMSKVRAEQPGLFKRAYPESVDADEGEDA